MHHHPAPCRGAPLPPAVTHGAPAGLAGLPRQRTPRHSHLGGTQDRPCDAHPCGTHAVVSESFAQVALWGRVRGRGWRGRGEGEGGGRGGQGVTKTHTPAAGSPSAPTPPPPRPQTTPHHCTCPHTTPQLRPNPHTPVSSTPLTLTACRPRARTRSRTSGRGTSPMTPMLPRDTHARGGAAWGDGGPPTPPPWLLGSPAGPPLPPLVPAPPRLLPSPAGCSCVVLGPAPSTTAGPASQQPVDRTRGYPHTRTLGGQKPGAASTWRLNRYRSGGGGGRGFRWTVGPTAQGLYGTTDRPRTPVR